MRKCIDLSSWLRIKGFFITLIERYTWQKLAIDNQNAYFIYFHATSCNEQVATNGCNTQFSCSVYLMHILARESCIHVKRHPKQCVNPKVIHDHFIIWLKHSSGHATQCGPLAC